MKFSFSILCILLSKMVFAQLSALHPDSLSAWSKDSEVVLHIRTDTTAVENWPSFWHDLGTTYTHMPFEIVDFYKRGDTLDNSHIIILHSYVIDLKEWMSPNEEYIVFLPRQYSRGNQNWVNADVVPEPDGTFLLTREKCFSFNPDDDAILKKFYRITRIDQCVYNEDWKGVENELKALVRICSNSAGNENSAAVRLLQELSSYNSIHRVEFEKCVGHNAIYPGWISLLIRFANKNGPHDFILTASLGKVYRHGWLRYKLGMRTSRDKLYYHSFVPVKDVFEIYRGYCLIDAYQRAFYPKFDQNLIWKCELLTDTIPSPNSVIRARISVHNRSQKVQVLSWPVHQNSGDKSTLFRLVASDGILAEEDTPYIYLPHDETLEATTVPLQPGDSLWSIETINNPFTFYSEGSAQHPLSFQGEQSYALQWVYRPTIPEYASIDTSWTVPGPCTIAAPIPLRVGDAGWMSDTLVVQWIQGTTMFQTREGHHAVSHALVKIVDAQGSSDFSTGQTIGLRMHLPFYVQEHYYDETIYDLLSKSLPGAYLRVVVQTFGPVETDVATGIKNYMISFQSDAVAPR